MKYDKEKSITGRIEIKNPGEEKNFGLAKPFKMNLKKSKVEFRLLRLEFTVETGVLGRVKSIKARPDIS